MSDIISDSSGVGTNSDSAACSIGHPSTMVVCTKIYASNAVGHINLQLGDVIEVVGSTNGGGLLEGYVRGSNHCGFFPAECVQEVHLRPKHSGGNGAAGVNVISSSISQSSPMTTATTMPSPYQQHAGNVQSISVSCTSTPSGGLMLHQGSPQLSVGGSSGIDVGSSTSGSLSRSNHIINNNSNTTQSLSSASPTNTILNGVGNEMLRSRNGSIQHNSGNNSIVLSSTAGSSFATDELSVSEPTLTAATSTSTVTSTIDNDNVTQLNGNQALSQYSSATAPRIKKR